MAPTDKPDSNLAYKSASPEGNQSASKSNSAAVPNKRRARFVLFVVLVLPILIIAAIYFFRKTSPYRSTDDAYVHGNEIFLMPRVTGTVVAINADDTDLVHKSRPLVVLDDSDAKVQLSQSEAALADTMRKVCQFYANVREASAAVEARKIDLAKAEDDYRRRTAAQSGTVSVEDITHAHQAVDSACDMLEVAEQELAAAQALIVNTDLKHHPMVLQAEADVLNADLALQRTVIDAPETGYIAKRNVQIGQRVTPGTPLLAIIPLDQIWVDANYKEEQLKNVRIGQPVTLTSDFYGSSIKYEGHVVGLGPGTGAAFSLLPPDEASGNWIKIIQRVPVRIFLDGKQLEQFPLRIGLSMHADINTSDHSGAALTQTPSDYAIYATTIYSNEWMLANELVQGLVKTNLEVLTNLTASFSASTMQENTEAKVFRE